MLIRETCYSLGLERLARTIAAAILALSIVAALGMAASKTAAVPINPDAGTGPSYSFCSGIAATYQSDVLQLERSSTTTELPSYDRYVGYDLAYWSATGCQTTWGSIHDWYRR